MEYVFCPKCGDRLSSEVLGDEGPVPFCTHCRLHFFNLAKPCVLVLVLNESNEVALLKQPYVSKDHWVLVAGHHSPGETAEDTAQREVREETGLSAKDCQYIGSYYHARNDGLMLGFLVLVASAPLRPSTEVAEARWAPFNEVPRFLRAGSTGLLHYQNVRKALEARNQLRSG